LEFVNPRGVSSWALKEVPKTGAYPLAALRGTAAEKQAQAALLRGPNREDSTNRPPVILHIDGEHRRENVAHVVCASGAAVEYPAQLPALRRARSFHGAEADGQQFTVDRIANHATLPDGTLRVQVYWTGYPQPTWIDWADAPHETLRVYLRRAARFGFPHTSADPPTAAPCDAAPAGGTAASGASAQPPAVRA